MIQHRQKTRWNVVIPLSILDNSKHMEIGLVVNLSARGMAVIGRMALPLDQPLELWLKFPNPSDPVLPVTAAAKWLEQDSKTRHYTIGLSFITVSPETLSVLQNAVAADESFF